MVTRDALRRAASDRGALAALLDPVAADAAAGSLAHVELLVWAVDELGLADYTIRRLVLDEWGRPGWPRRLAVVVAVVLAALVGGVADDAADRAFGGRTVTSTATGEGNVRTVVEEHGIEIRIEGPTRVAVNEPVQLTAQVEGAEEWLWIGPDGAMTTGTDELDLTASRAGHGTVQLLATDPAGRTVEARRRLTVTGTPQEEDR